MIKLAYGIIIILKLNQIYTFKIDSLYKNLLIKLSIKIKVIIMNIYHTTFIEQR
jgi:hypothetical protein